MKVTQCLLVGLGALAVVDASRCDDGGSGKQFGGGNGINTGGSTTAAGASTTAAVAATTTSAASSGASSSTSGTGSTGNGNDNTASTGNGNGSTASTGNGSNNTASTGNGNDNTGSTGNNNGNTGSGGANSLTLLAANVQSGSDSTGSANATAGQSDSATDPANFINFCSGQTLTNGLQVKTGSCNGIVMGNIPSTDNMIASIITFPGPGDTVAANQDFNISVQTQGLTAGSFTNADTTYYSAPQDLDGNGQIIGHTHVTVQDMGGNLATTTPPNPGQFTFFKGINDPGNGKGLLQAAVAGGLPAGSYRVCTMTSSSNHQPVLMPVAQRGAQDDCQKFTVTDGGAAGNGQTNTGSGSSAASSAAGSGSGSAATAAVAASSTTAAVGSTSTGTSGSTTGQGNTGGQGNSGGFSGQRGNRNGGGRKSRFMAREFVG